MTDSRLLRTLALELLLAVAWVPVLVRRGWSLQCTTRPAVLGDLARGAAVFALACLAYWFLFSIVAVVLPTLQEVARATQVGGAPSWWVVALMSLVNPIAEEFLYLGFITNLSRADGYHVGLIAGVLARVAVHVYQGPVGVVAAIAIGVVFGIYYLRSGRLWPVIVAHGLAGHHRPRPLGGRCGLTVDSSSRSPGNFEPRAYPCIRPSIRVSLLARIGLSVAVLAVLVYGLIWAKYSWDFRSIHVRLPARFSGPVTELLAVQGTREALLATGLDAERFEPVAYDHGGRLFARNASAPRDGYVLWRAPGRQRVFDYVVSCSWQASAVDCGVSRAH